MKITLLSLFTVLTAMLLSGCPDSKLPKVPPSTPEPKAASWAHNPTTVAGTDQRQAGGNA